MNAEPTTMVHPDAHGDPNLIKMVEGYFSATFTHDVATRVESEGPDRELWKSAAELGLPLIGIAEESGGSGGTLLDLVAVLQAAGRFAVPLPLAETNLAGWLSAASQASIPAGPLAVIPDPSGLTLNNGRLSGTASQVPWLRGAERVLALLPNADGSVLVSIDPANLAVAPGVDLAGMPSDGFTADQVQVETWASPISWDEFFLRGALLRSAQLAGAITGAFELARSYVGERVQFGKPIGHFQAVQIHLVELAEGSTLAALSVERAAIAAMSGPATLEVVSAKSAIGRHAELSARAAHQAHGAIGVTQEYSLQLLTRRLHTWRGEFGDELSLNLRLGGAMSTAGGVIAAATSRGSTTGV